MNNGSSKGCGQVGEPTTTHACLHPDPAEQIELRLLIAGHAQQRAVALPAAAHVAVNVLGRARKPSWTGS